MTHAGFWVDGAVRKPEARHCDSEDTVIARWKRKEDREQTLGVSNEFDICHRYFPSWDEVYWLDTTPRELLTPEELYGVLRVAWPHLQCIKKEDDDCWVLGHGYSTHTPIDWGDLTQYPPPVETQWICVTKENVKDYLFCECRFRNSTSHEWRSGVLCGWHNQDCCCLVDSDYVEEIPIMPWKYVEVQA